MPHADSSTVPPVASGLVKLANVPPLRPRTRDLVRPDTHLYRQAALFDLDVRDHQRARPKKVMPRGVLP